MTFQPHDGTDQQKPPAPHQPTPVRVTRAPTPPRIRHQVRQLEAGARGLFYSALLFLPFELTPLSLPIWPFLFLAALGCWAVAWLRNPQRALRWGAWYMLVPLGVFLALLTPAYPSSMLLLVGLYLFTVNALAEEHLSALGLTLTGGGLLHAAVATGAATVPGLQLSSAVQTAQYLPVAVLSSLALVLRNTATVQKLVDCGAAIGLLGLTVLLFPTPGSMLLGSLFCMMLLWMMVRERLAPYAPSFLITAVPVFTLILLNISKSPPQLLYLTPSQGIQNIWYLSFIIFVTPICSAFTSRFFTKHIQIGFLIVNMGFFTITIAAIVDAFFEPLTSTSNLWPFIGLSVIISLMLLCILDITTILFALSNTEKKYRLIIEFLILFGKIFLLPPFVGILLVINGLFSLFDEQPPMIVVLISFIAIYGCLLYILGISNLLLCIIIISGCMLGCSAVISIQENLNLGCGSVVLTVALMIGALTLLVGSGGVLLQVWPLLLAVVVAIGAWRNQRVATFVVSNALIAGCLLSLADPPTWLALPHAALLVTLMGFWVDKTNIPLGLKVRDADKRANDRLQKPQS